ncbi:MAG: HPr family phosphocarrier protein [Candidatus Omnitrophota bacterium]
MERTPKPLVRTIEIMMPCHLGFHLRAAGRFVTHVKRFSSAIRVRRGKVTVDGKNIMALLLLAAAWRSKIHIEAEGDDAGEAIACIEGFFQMET